MARISRKGLIHLLLAIALLAGLASTGACLSNTKLIIAEEASALVYDYLQIRVDNTEDDSARWERQATLTEARTQFDARFLSDGQWLVQALGWDETYTHTGGEWYVYERTRTVEPANRSARELLQQWQGPVAGQ
jgi:hypothetical protein